VTVSGFFAHLCEPATDKARPQTAIAAKFSAPFTVAIALRNRGVTLSDFEPSRLQDRETQALAARVSHTIEKGWSGPAATRGAVAIGTVTGERFAHSVEFPLGHPANSMTDDAIVAKFRDCVRHARTPMNADAVERLIDSLSKLDALADVRAIFSQTPGDQRCVA
jgi:2-methylcitrate dehydratase PrpD